MSETDANGHTTTYSYNALDQRTTTTYHDGTTVEETFDALGRRTAVLFAVSWTPKMKTS